MHWSPGGYMNRDHIARAPVRALSLTLTAVGALALSFGAMATDKESPRLILKNGLSAPDALNMQLLGHSDMQARPIYQPTVHKQGGRVILYAGLHAGTALNPLTGAVEPNGVLIVDVTNPSAPNILAHLPSIAPNQDGQMAGAW